MGKDSKRKELERLLRKCPDVLTPTQAVHWSPFGKNRIYELLKSKELRSFSYCGKYIIAKADLIDYLLEHCDDDTGKTFRINTEGGQEDV